MNDRFLNAIKRILEMLLPDFDLYALHPASVLASSSAGGPDGESTVDVRPGNSRLPDLTGVPLRGMSPGEKITVQAGARVLIAFEGAQRDQPIALLFGAGGLSTLEISASQEIKLKATTINLEGLVNLGGQAGLPVARVTDGILGYIPAGTVMTSAGVPNPVPIPVTGEITAGSSKVKSE
jgi:hypothetical protein